MKAYRIEILAIDYDNVGEEEIKDTINNANFPNGSPIVTVMGITGVEAATMSIPSPNNERIAIADNEKAFVNPNNISIA